VSTLMHGLKGFTFCQGERDLTPLVSFTFYQSLNVDHIRDHWCKIRYAGGGGGGVVGGGGGGGPGTLLCRQLNRY